MNTINCFQIRNSVTLRVAVTKYAPGCNNGCCDAYVAAQNDCDIDFAINTGFSLLAGGIATIGGTPIAGAAALSVGIGAAYMVDLRCNNTAVAGYRSCMGY